MNETDELAAVPRGNTAKGVNRCVAEELLRAFDRESAVSVLDIPCGNGEFVYAMRAMCPKWSVTGADINIDVTNPDLVQVDASTDALSRLGFTFDGVTCISGVMEFHNTLRFFEQLRGVIAADGVLIVTNDNLLTVRDRVLYFLFGRFAQYPFSFGSQPTWQIMPLQNITRALVDAGFEIERVRYVPVLTPHWLLLPIALPLHLLGHLYREPGTRTLFPLVSMLAKHYLLICRPR